MSVSKLAYILDQGARETNQRVLRDTRNGLRAHEPTLTQNFVSDYANRTRLSFLATTVREFSAHQEATAFGADLALWFTNGLGQFVGVYLQAKAMFPDGSYRGLDHWNALGPQHDMLLRASARDGVFAGYAFYSGFRGPEPISSACSHGLAAPEINGISIASATSVTSLISGRVGREKLEPLSSPLSCLVRHGHGGAPSDAPPGSVVDSVKYFAEIWNSNIRAHDEGSIPQYLRAVLTPAAPFEPDDEQVQPDHQFSVEYNDEPRITVLLTHV